MIEKFVKGIYKFMNTSCLFIYFFYIIFVFVHHFLVSRVLI